MMGGYTKDNFSRDLCTDKVNTIEEPLNSLRVLFFRIKNKAEAKLKHCMVNTKDSFKMGNYLVSGCLNGMAMMKTFTRDILGTERCMAKEL
jgi:hypothetical protein